MYVKSKGKGSGAVTQRSRAFAVLAEGPGMYTVHIHTCKQNTHTYKTTKNISKMMLSNGAVLTGNGLEVVLFFSVITISPYHGASFPQAFQERCRHPLGRAWEVRRDRKPWV